MGRKRGQRNAAREKVWPGAEAADVRAEKQGAVVQYGAEADCKSVAIGSTGSIPVGPTTLDTPPSDLAALERRENAEDGTLRSPVHGSGRKAKGRRVTRRKPAKAAMDRPLRKLREERSAIPHAPKISTRSKLTAEDLEAKRELYHLLSNLYAKSKTDFFMVLAGFNDVEYALPEMWHECNPEELMDLFDCIDWHRMALALGYREVEIRKYARA